jgi:hypothetical protein
MNRANQRFRVAVVGLVAKQDPLDMSLLLSVSGDVVFGIGSCPLRWKYFDM